MANAKLKPGDLVQYNGPYPDENNSWGVGIYCGLKAKHLRCGRPGEEGHVYWFSRDGLGRLRGFTGINKISKLIKVS